MLDNFIDPVGAAHILVGMYESESGPFRMELPTVEDVMVFVGILNSTKEAKAILDESNLLVAVSGKNVVVMSEDDMQSSECVLLNSEQMEKLERELASTNDPEIKNAILEKLRVKALQ